ncbi:MAG TPA: hypothetical protein VIQ05_23260 [Tardiphaga sp.]
MALPPFPAIVALLAVLYAALFGYFIWDTAGQMSGYDFLDWIMQYGDGPGDWPAYLWAPHNEHRIAADRLLIGIDIGLFRGTGLPFVIVRTILLLAMVSGIARQIWRSNIAPPFRTIAIALLVFTLLPANLVVMCSMPLMGGFVHSTTFAVFALLLWDNDSRLRQVAALIAALVAGFGVAGGLFVWPVLVFFAWRSGARSVQITLLAIAGVAMWAVYLRGLLPHDGLLSLAPSRLLAMLDFVVRFLGLPWSHATALVWPGRVIGVAVAATGCWLVVSDAFSGRVKPSFERVGLGMIQFALLVAAAAAVARWNMAPDREIPIRYGMIVALADAGILLASLRWLGRVLEGRRAAAAKAAIMLIATGLLVQQVLVGRAAVAEVGRYRDAWSRFSAGQWTPDMMHYVYPDRARAEQTLQFLKSRHLYGE